MSNGFEQDLTRYSKVQRIPVLELLPHRLQSFLTYVALHVISPGEDIVPDIVSHLLRLDIAQTPLSSKQVFMQIVGNVVVGRIDSTVTKRFDQKLLVPP